MAASGSQRVSEMGSIEELRPASRNWARLILSACSALLCLSESAPLQQKTRAERVVVDCQLFTGGDSRAGNERMPVFGAHVRPARVIQVRANIHHVRPERWNADASVVLG